MGTLSLAARYFADGFHCATATFGRDEQSLEDEAGLEVRAAEKVAANAGLTPDP